MTVEQAWEAGMTVQYLVLFDYNAYWTDYTGKVKPDFSNLHIAWRVKP